MIVRELITLLGFKLEDGPQKQYDKQIDKTKEKSNALAGAAKGIGSAYKWAAAAVGIGIGWISKNILDVAAETERYRVVLGTMIGDQEKANKIIHDLDYSPVSDFYGTAKAIGGLQGMVTFGMQAEEASDVLTRLGDIAQGNSEAFVSMSQNMGQVFAKGKADATDLKQFVMQGFDVVGEIAKQSGKSRAEIEKAGVTYQQTADALKMLTSEGGKYYGMLAKQADTITGIGNQFKSLFAATGETIGTSVLKPLKDTLRYILDIAKSFQDNIANAGTSAFKTVITVIQDVIIFFQLLQMRMKKFGGAFTPIKALIGDVFGFIKSIITSVQPLLMNLAQLFLIAFKPIREFVRPVLEALKPVFKDVFDYLADIVAGVIPIINGLTPVFRVLGNIVGAIVSVFANGGMTIIKALTPLAGIILAIVAAIKIWTAIQWLLNVALNANPVGLIIIAVVALIGIITLLVKNLDKVKEFFIKIGTAIAGFFKAVWNTITGLFNKLISFVKKNLVNIVNVILTIIFPIGGIVMALVRLIIKHWDKIKAALVKVFTFVVEKLKAIWGKIVNVVKGIIDKVKQIWNTIVLFISNLGDKIKTIWEVVWNKILEIVQGIIEGIKEAWNTFIGFFTGLWEGIKNTTASIWEGVKNIFLGAVEGIKNIWNGLIGFFTGLWDALKESAAAAIEFIKNAFFGLFENIKGFFFGFIDKIKQGWETVKGFFNGIGDGVVNFFTGGGNEGAKPVNDLIVTPEGQYSTHPDDYVMAMKNPGDLIDSIMRFLAGPQPQPAYAGSGSLTGNAIDHAARQNTYNSSSNVSNITAPINVKVDASGMTPDMASAVVKRGVEDALREAINGSRGSIPSPEARRH
jgi:phage-related protein